MGRGRKPISNFNGSEWETVFYNSVGTYVQYINSQLSKEYKAEPLSKHLKIVGGYAFKTSEYQNQGIPIIRISDFNNEQIVLKDVVYYQESRELDKYQLLEGDIIIALTGGTIAKLAIVQAGLGKIYLNQRVGKFQALKPDEFEVEYIYWLARSIQSIIKNLAWGAAIPNVSPKQIEELNFPFPPKETQRGIINFLNDLKNKDLKSDKVYFNESIESEILLLHEKQLTANSFSTELTHQLSLVKKLRQKLLQDAVQGKLVKQDPKDEPASELLKKIKAEKEKLIAEKKIKKEKELPPIKPEEIPFELPENWVWCRLGEIIQFVGGSQPDKGKFQYEDGPELVRLVQIRDFRTDNFKTYIPKVLATRMFNQDDIMIGRYGPPVFQILRGLSGSYNVALMKATPIENLMSKDFCYHLLREKRIQEIIIIDSERTAGQTGIRKPLLDSIVFALPSLEEQNRIVQKLDELMQYCDELEASIKQSESQNEKLLQQVLREALRKEPVIKK